MSQFVTIIRYEFEVLIFQFNKSNYLNLMTRNRMTLNSHQAFYLLIDDKGIASMSMTLSELYEKKRDSDGFLYMSYASQGKYIVGC